MAPLLFSNLLSWPSLHSGFLFFGATQTLEKKKVVFTGNKFFQAPQKVVAIGPDLV